MKQKSLQLTLERLLRLLKCWIGTTCGIKHKVQVDEELVNANTQLEASLDHKKTLNVTQGKLLDYCPHL